MLLLVLVYFFFGYPTTQTFPDSDLHRRFRSLAHTINVSQSRVAAVIPQHAVLLWFNPISNLTMFSSSCWAGFGFNDHQIPLKKSDHLKDDFEHEHSNHQLCTSIFFGQQSIWHFHLRGADWIHSPGSSPFPMGDVSYEGTFVKGSCKNIIFAKNPHRWYGHFTIYYNPNIYKYIYNMYLHIYIYIYINSSWHQSFWATGDIHQQFADFMIHLIYQSNHEVHLRYNFPMFGRLDVSAAAPVFWDGKSFPCLKV